MVFEFPSKLLFYDSVFNWDKMNGSPGSRRALFLTDTVHVEKTPLPFAIGEITLLSCFQIPQSLVPVKKAEAAQGV